MNAINFIQQHGVEKAREVLKAIPEKQHWFSEVMMNETGKWVVMQVVSLIHETGEKYTSTFQLCKEWQPKFTKLNDLKRLVESVKLVGKVHGITTAKAHVKQAYEQGYSTISIPVEINGSIGMGCLYIDTLEKAIADYEAVGGEHV